MNMSADHYMVSWIPNSESLILSRFSIWTAPNKKSEKFGIHESMWYISRRAQLGILMISNLCIAHRKLFLGTHSRLERLKSILKFGIRNLGLGIRESMWVSNLCNAHRKLFIELSFKVSKVLVLNLEIQNYEFGIWNSWIFVVTSSIRYFDDFESVYCPQKVISRLSFKVSKVLGAEFVVTFSSRLHEKVIKWHLFFRSKRGIGWKTIIWVKYFNVFTQIMMFHFKKLTTWELANESERKKETPNSPPKPWILIPNYGLGIRESMWWAARLGILMISNLCIAHRKLFRGFYSRSVRSWPWILFSQKSHVAKMHFCTCIFAKYFSQIVMRVHMRIECRKFVLQNSYCPAHQMAVKTD